MNRYRNPPAPRALAVALPRQSSDHAARAAITLAATLLVASVLPMFL
ncbi:MAG: hypothetical protein LJE69_03685 [Thiohalocapsa sp.]|jgi:hypothetical protein|nr:hypothetical protein [Thiohalocapsa sp.]MCG6940336.1 hypothetical protein [Thiohalocapsa sp.]